MLGGGWGLGVGVQQGTDQALVPWDPPYPFGLVLRASSALQVGHAATLHVLRDLGKEVEVLVHGGWSRSGGWSWVSAGTSFYE